MSLETPLAQEAHMTRKSLGGVALALALLTSQWSTLAIPHQAGRLRLEARLFSQIVPTDPGAGVGPGQQGRGFTDCGTFGEAGRGFFDKDVSCDDPIAPDNELAIAVHPTNPNLLLAGSNDYQISFKGNAAILQVPSGFFFSSDAERGLTVSCRCEDRSAAATRRRRSISNTIRWSSPACRLCADSWHRSVRGET